MGMKEGGDRQAMESEVEGGRERETRRTTSKGEASEAKGNRGEKRGIERGIEMEAKKTKIEKKHI